MTWAWDAGRPGEAGNPVPGRGGGDMDVDGDGDGEGDAGETVVRDSFSLVVTLFGAAMRVRVAWKVWTVAGRHRAC